MWIDLKVKGSGSGLLKKPSALVLATEKSVEEKRISGVYYHLKGFVHEQFKRKKRVYNHFSPSFQSTSDVRQDCLVSSFLYKFLINDILETALKSVCCWCRVVTCRKLFGLECGNDIVLYSKNTQAIQIALSQLAICIRKYGMYFAPPKYKVLLQD